MKRYFHGKFPQLRREGHPPNTNRAKQNTPQQLIQKQSKQSTRHQTKNQPPNTPSQMFPAVISTKLEAAIEREEDRRRQKLQAEKGKGRTEDKKGRSASEFEVLLNEYSKIEATEIAVGVCSKCSRRTNMYMLHIDTSEHRTRNNSTCR